VHFWHLLFRFHYLFNGGIYRIRHILQERGSRIRIESSPEVSVEIDGEPLGHTPLEFSILHRAIRIVVARDFYQRCAAVGAETPAGERAAGKREDRTHFGSGLFWLESSGVCAHTCYFRKFCIALPM